MKIRFATTRNFTSPQDVVPYIQSIFSAIQNKFLISNISRIIEIPSNKSIIDIEYEIAPSENPEDIDDLIQAMVLQHPELTLITDGQLSVEISQNQSEPAQSPFSKLPKELVLKIIDSIDDIFTLGALLKTCRFLKNTVDSSLVWNKFLLPSAIQAVGDSTPKNFFLRMPSARSMFRVFDEPGRKYFLRSRTHYSEKLEILVDEKIISKEAAVLISEKISAYNFNTTLLSDKHFLKALQENLLSPEMDKVDLERITPFLSLPNFLIALREKLMTPQQAVILAENLHWLLKDNWFPVLREKLLTAEKIISAAPSKFFAQSSRSLLENIQCAKYCGPLLSQLIWASDIALPEYNETNFILLNFQNVLNDVKIIQLKLLTYIQKLTEFSVANLQKVSDLLRTAKKIEVVSSTYEFPGREWNCYQTLKKSLKEFADINKSSCEEIMAILDKIAPFSSSTPTGSYADSIRFLSPPTSTAFQSPANSSPEQQQESDQKTAFRLVP